MHLQNISTSQPLKGYDMLLEEKFVLCMMDMLSIWCSRFLSWIEEVNLNIEVFTCIHSMDQ
jgi:hypothetical protein